MSDPDHPTFREACYAHAHEVIVSAADEAGYVLPTEEDEPDHHFLRRFIAALEQRIAAALIDAK